MTRTLDLFGLPASEVSQLTRTIGGEHLEGEQLREKFARATWSGITEPDDRVAGTAISILGAADALTAIVNRWELHQWKAALQGSDITEDELQTAIGRWAANLKSSRALIALRQAARFGARLLTPDDELWPKGLADLGVHSPTALWIRGTDTALRSLSLSACIQGTRVGSGLGESLAIEISAGLVDRGVALVTSCDLGIAGMVARAAIAANGQTIAILAAGVDRFWPAAHESLQGKVVERGAVLSELPPGSPVTKYRVLARGRLLAAISQVTIVLEAPIHSLCLQTAAHAIGIGRPLGSVPGPANGISWQGSFRLLRDYGATCVTNTDEISQLLPDAP